MNSWFEDILKRYLSWETYTLKGNHIGYFGFKFLIVYKYNLWKLSISTASAKNGDNEIQGAMVDREKHWDLGWSFKLIYKVSYISRI